MSIILASASPRRLELMKIITDDFSVIPSNAEEIVPDGMRTCDMPRYLAKIKAEAVAKDHGDDIVIGCDTSVLIGDMILGKPKTAEDAENMLRMLSGKIHTVITGCCIMYRGKTLSFEQATDVEFHKLSDDEIKEYVQSGEPMDKAGAYGIQKRGALLVKGITGDYFNVVGFPVALISKKIKEITK